MRSMRLSLALSGKLKDSNWIKDGHKEFSSSSGSFFVSLDTISRSSMSNF